MGLKVLDWYWFSEVPVAKSQGITRASVTMGLTIITITVAQRQIVRREQSK